jgi:hypothetical protein
MRERHIESKYMNFSLVMSVVVEYYSVVVQGVH